MVQTAGTRRKWQATCVEAVEPPRAQASLRQWLAFMLLCSLGGAWGHARTWFEPLPLVVVGALLIFSHGKLAWSALYGLGWFAVNAIATIFDARYPSLDLNRELANLPLYAALALIHCWVTTTIGAFWRGHYLLGCASAAVLVSLYFRAMAGIP